MKLLIKLSIAIVVLLFAGIALLLILVNPNDYKTEIETQVKQSINRDLHIKGDLDWALYPQLGFRSGEIELDNLKGFNQPHLIKINQASLGLNILPLLKGEISLAKLTIDGFQLSLITDKNGLSNLDNIETETPTTNDVTISETTENTETSSNFFDISKTQLDGIEINNTVIEVQDLQADSSQRIVINEIKLGQFAFNQETEFSINTTATIDDLAVEVKLTTQLLVDKELIEFKLNHLLLTAQATTDSLPNGEVQSTLKGNVNYALNSKKISIDGLNINTVISGDNLPNKKVSTQLNADIVYLLNNQQATISNLKILVDDKLKLDGGMSVKNDAITTVRYNLVANEWDLNAYMSGTASEDSSASNEPDAQQEVEPDLSFLNNLDIDGTLKIAGLLVNNVKIGEINKHLIIKQGKAQLAPLSAQLYDGSLTLNASVDESNGANKYQLSTQLKDVQLMPLLKDAAELEVISGDTTFNFNGKGQGLTATQIQQGLTGTGDFSLLDGELYGVNINQEIRSLKASLKGEDAPTSDSIKKTDFASLTGKFSIAEGLVNNQELLMISPAMRLDGAGLVDTIEQTLDYKLSISPLSSSTAETDYSELSGVTIPLLIAGTFSEPSFSIDTESVLKEQVQAELDAQKEKLAEKAEKELQRQAEKISNKLGTNLDTKSIEDKLKSFF